MQTCMRNCAAGTFIEKNIPFAYRTDFAVWYLQSFSFFLSWQIRLHCGAGPHLLAWLPYSSALVFVDASGKLNDLLRKISNPAPRLKWWPSHERWLRDPTAIEKNISV